MTTAVQELALGVIADIEKYGHFQNLPGQTVWPNGKGQCCVVISPSSLRTNVPASTTLAFYRAFLDATGVEYEPKELPVPLVSDALGTDEVLDALWAVAIG